MSLYSVSFTTRKIVTRYGDKREVISETEMDVPVTINGLPRSTAESYAKCDNFRISQDYTKAAGMDTKVNYRKTRGGKTYRDVEVQSSAPKAAPRPKSPKLDAAATGDLGAALNG